MKYSLGVDIGGTKIAAVILDQNGIILHRTEMPSEPDDKEEMFNQVICTIQRLFSKSHFTVSMLDGIGVGVPGKVDRKNGVAVFQNNLQWKNFPIADRLQDYFGFDHVVIDNDVYMAAFAEWMAANMNQEDTFVYVTVSTGISCSIIQNGSFLRGAGFAGELGLLPVGNSGMENIQRLENAASGPAIQKTAVKRFGRADMTAQEFFQEYENGNVKTKTVLNDAVRYLAGGVYSIVSLLDPHKIVFGGGVMNHHPYLLELLKAEIGDFLIDAQKDSLARMQMSQLKGDSGVVGAGLKAISEHALRMGIDS
ncbi:ROK family protein [Virgibacillus siamensis]|uniref:ROK family protein n=1 Tax=Virgibacillus siamensis TaxID=480071 RepID=UPI0009861102|nr:ROK family protein [Virgibacillus siamensis]